MAFFKKLKRKFSKRRRSGNNSLNEPESSMFNSLPNYSSSLLDETSSSLQIPEFTLNESSEINLPPVLVEPSISEFQETSTSETHLNEISYISTSEPRLIETSETSTLPQSPEPNLDEILEINDLTEDLTENINNNNNNVDENNDMRIEHDYSNNVVCDLNDMEDNLHNFKQIFQFLNNFQKNNIIQICHIEKYLKNTQISNTMNNLGFPVHIYKYCIIKIILNDEECNVDNIVTNYYDILNTRIINIDFHYKLEKLKLKLLNINEDLHDYLVNVYKSKMKCLICKESFIEILFLPCGHLILCSDCYDSTRPINCIDCTTYIEEHHFIQIN